MRLDWSEPAVRDLQDIHDYISRDSEYYASRFVERLLDAAEQLTAFPRLGRIVPEVRSPDTRELLFSSYRIVYRLERGRVLMVVGVHGARDWSQKEQKPWDVE
jgi:toxin ParE1/3/4